jgi:hypothetical protein
LAYLLCEVTPSHAYLGTSLEPTFGEQHWKQITSIATAAPPGNAKISRPVFSQIATVEVKHFADHLMCAVVDLSH